MTNNLKQLDRLITKYDGSEWNTKETANRIVELLVEHRSLIQIELNEVNTGMRKLTDRDFLGPKERQKRRKLKSEEDNKVKAETNNRRDHSEYFKSLEVKILEKKRYDMRTLARKQAEENAANATP